jgi:predicted permease
MSILSTAGTLRTLRRHRGYVAFASITLAVAVGVNLVVFTVVNALWLRPLPFPEADRLVEITNSAYVTVDAPALRVFEAVAGQVITSDSSAGLRPQILFSPVTHDLETIGVTPGYFRLLGLAVRGRDFMPDDNRPGAEPVAIISDRLWTRDLGRQPAAIGAVIAAKPFPIRIIGVAPPAFTGARRGERVDVWIPSALVPRAATAAGMVTGDSRPGMMVYGRLHPGQTPNDVTRRLVETATEADRRFMANFTAVPLKDVYGTPELRTLVIREGGALGVAAGLAALVLLGGCATLMAVVLVHYERRRRDLALRSALGASRVRLTAELVRELGIVAMVGTGGALLVALWGLRVIPSLRLPGGVDLARLDLSFDWRVLSTAIAATMLTLMAAAFLPLRRFTRANLVGVLVAGPTTTTSLSSHRVRQALLAIHVCATIVVLVAAGLFVRAVVHGFGSAPGFAADRTLFVTVQTASPYRDRGPADREILRERTRVLTEALRALPGVESIAKGAPPIGPVQVRSLLAPVQVDTGRGSFELVLGRSGGSSEWLPALGVPILAGRALTDADVTAAPRPILLTASLARALYPAGGPLGQVISIGSGRGGGRYQVVGVAGDFVFGSFSRPSVGVTVIASESGGGIEPNFVIRASSPEALIEPIRRVVKETLPDAPWMAVETGREIVARDLGPQRLGAWFFSGFGLTALILGVGGVFGLVAYLAESRQRDFGVRLALGATPHDLVKSALAAALAPVSFGVVAGLLLAAFVARLFAVLLAGLSGFDPLTYATVALMMVGSAGLAGLSAAWRLRRVMPTTALRRD